MTRIDRCYCFQKTFASLKETAEDTGASTLEELQEHVQFGENCQLCHPYVRRMLKTGETTFSTIFSGNESSSDVRDLPESGN